MYSNTGKLNPAKYLLAKWKYRFSEFNYRLVLSICIFEFSRVDVEMVEVHHKKSGQLVTQLLLLGRVVAVVPAAHTGIQPRQHTGFKISTNNKGKNEEIVKR